MKEAIQKAIKDWEKEFDEKFNKPVDRNWIEKINNPHVYLDNTDIKSFIRTLLQAREEEIKSWVKKNSYEPIDSYSSPEDGMGIVDTGRLLKFLTTKPK